MDLWIAKRMLVFLPAPTLENARNKCAATVTDSSY
jgi:hypothetical protein